MYIIIWYNIKFECSFSSKVKILFAVQLMGLVSIEFINVLLSLYGNDTIFGQVKRVKVPQLCTLSHPIILITTCT